MASILKSSIDKLRKNAFVAVVREAKKGGYLASILADGNLLNTKLRAIDADLVGVDDMGNKYYQNLHTQFGRHRWVEYADPKNYNASAIPPEWHGWLHYITDHTAEQLLELKPKRYGLPHRENMSGRGDGMIYHSKGHALNPNKRDWKRYQSWQPENADLEAKSVPASPNSL